jgi:hypothetical protein
MLEHREETDAIARERKAFRRRQAAFAAINSHTSMDLMAEYNAVHEEWRAAKAEVERILDEIRSGKRP